VSEGTYDWGLTVTIEMKDKTQAEYNIFLEQVKTALKNAKDGGVIISARIDVRQAFTDKTWQIPEV